MRRGFATSDVESSLLGVDLDTLLTTAKALLPAYSERRHRLALEELLGNVNDAAEAIARLKQAQVPWVPPNVEPPFTADGWRWGIRAGQRVLYLLISILRTQLIYCHPQDTERRERLLQARLAAHEEVAKLEALRDMVRSRADPDVDALLDTLAGYGPFVYERVRAGAEAVLGDRELALGELADGQDIREALVGRTRGGRQGKALSEAGFQRFLSRALAIEVLRGALASSDEDADLAPRLHFAQLTPFSPCPLLSAAPFTQSGPDSPEAKLTGIRLGHFSAFYRRAWRANDFMWGRLDAASRIVQMLVDPLRASALRRDDWTPLVDAILPAEDSTPAQRALVHEALTDARIPESGVHRSVVDALGEWPSAPDGELLPVPELRDLLGRALAADLHEQKGGEFTRVVCTRAVQLEVMLHELPEVVAESVADVAQGTLQKALPLPAAPSWDSIQALRASEESLPTMLGRDRADEMGSSLALRTITHAVLVGLVALKKGRVPLVGTFSVVRAPMLAVAGVVSRGLSYRMAAAFAFVSASFFLTGRVTGIGRGSESLGTGRLLAVIVTVLALLGVLGIILVPVLRGRYARWRRRVLEWGAAAVLAATGGLLAIGLALGPGDIGLAQLVTAPGADRPATAVLTLLIGVVLGLPVSRLPVIGHHVNAILKRPWGGLPALVLLAVSAGLTLCWSIPEVADALGAAEWWKVTAGSAALASLVAAPLYVFVLARR